MTLLFAFASAIFSGLCLGLLMLSDRKRYSRSEPLLSIKGSIRKTLGILCSLPIIILFSIGQFSALLVWLGIVTILGWLLAVLPQKKFKVKII